MSPQEQMKRALGNPPPRESYVATEQPVLSPVSEFIGMSEPVPMKTKSIKQRAGVLFACNYKGESKHYREIVLFDEYFSFRAHGNQHDQQQEPQALFKEPQKKQGALWQPAIRHL